MRNSIEFLYKKEFDKQKQRHTADNHVPANPLRTSSIFHFTKSLDSLIGILSNGLIPNYCSETLYDKEGINITLGVPMVSFCDIPLSRTYEHTIKYGYFAIGLGSEYAEDNNINPLLYIANDQLIRRAFPSIFSGKSMRPKMVLPSSYLGLLKRTYGEFKGQEINNYAENEWRYIVPSDRKFLKWFYTKEEYMEWRGNVDEPKPSPMQNPFLESRKLIFTAKDINYIIVETEKDIPMLIAYLLNASQIGGSKTRLSDQDKYYLINHITSFERIRRDY